MTLVWASGYNGITVPDPDATAYLRNVEVADNQAIELSVATAVNTFVVGCKLDGIWDAIKASCILAGARTLSGALVPLKGTAPTNFNFVAGDYNRETGLVGDASTKYLDSNRANNADPQNSNHNAVYVTQIDTVNATSMAMAGGSTGVGANNLAYSGTNSSRTVFRNRSSTGTTISGGQDQTGLFAMNRDNSSDFVYRFGGANGTIIRTSQAPSSANVLIFNRSDGAYTNARFAFYSIGESLDLALLDTRVSTLMTDIGAAIP